jgi:hypothetical protein
LRSGRRAGELSLYPARGFFAELQCVNGMHPVSSIYHIREDMLGNPYRAVQVAWLQQEKGTNQWVYTYTQTDSGMQLLGLYGVPSSGSCVGSALCS